LDVLFITLPIFSLIGLGFGGARLGLFDDSVGAGLSRFVFWLAFPALLLSSMAKAPAPDITMAGQIGLWLGVLMAFQLGGRIAARIVGLDKASAAGVAMASTCGNTAFLGTAILTSLMGPSILPLVAAFVGVENIVVVGIGVAGLKLSGAKGLGLSAVLRTVFGGVFNPTSVGALIGFIIALSGYDLPSFVARPLELLGGAASPAGLVALGIVMATMTTSITRDWRATCLVVAFKCVLVPLAMFAVFSAAGTPPSITIAATVLAACPSAVNVFIQARQANVWPTGAATAVFVTTMVSIIGVSLAAGLAAQ
jgi:malonate transporter and related proteins